MKINRKKALALIILTTLILGFFTLLIAFIYLKSPFQKERESNWISILLTDSVNVLPQKAINPGADFLTVGTQYHNDSLKHNPFFSTGKSTWNYIAPLGLNIMCNILSANAVREKDLNLEISAYIYQGIVNYNFRNTPDTIDNNYFKTALNLSKNSNNRYGIIISSCNLAKNFQTLNNPDSCLYYMNYAFSNLEFSEDSFNIKNNLFIAYYYNTKAFLSNSSKQYDSSIASSFKAIEYLEKKINFDLLSYTYTNLADNFSKLNKFKESINYALKGINAADKAGNYQNILKCQEQLYLAYYSLGESAKALQALKTVKIMNDNILNYRINNIRMDSDFNSYKLEGNLRIFIFFVIVYFLSFILIIIILIYFYKKISKKNKDINKLSGDNSRINSFFKIISHDLKTPLYSFNSLAKLLSIYYERLSDQEIIEYINNLRDSSDNVLLLLNNLLTWSELQKESICVQPDNFNLLNLIDNEVKIQSQFALLKKITICVDIKSSTFVFIDYDMFCIVIRNLLSNAIKFTPKGGNIKIISEENDFSHAVVIMDNGIGIEESDKSKLFNIEVKYSKLGTFKEKGTGLGLCLCKELVELNKGILSFTSVYGEGSSFKVVLPKN